MGAEQSTSSDSLGTPFVPKKQLSVKVRATTTPDESEAIYIHSTYVRGFEAEDDHESVSETLC